MKISKGADTQQIERFNNSIEFLINDGRIRSVRTLAKSLEVIPQYIYDIQKFKKGMTNDFIEEFCKITGVNKDYIINGNSPLLAMKVEKDNSLSRVEEPTIEYGLNSKMVMRPYSIDAIAGKLSECVDGIREKDCRFYPKLAGFGDYDYTINISGDSMVDKFFPGDMVACKFIKSSSFIQWGRVHVIDTSQGVIVKKIMPHQKDEFIVATSFNKHYPDVVIPRVEIFSLSLVLGLVRLD